MTIETNARLLSWLGVKLSDSSRRWDEKDVDYWFEIEDILKAGIPVVDFNDICKAILVDIKNILRGDGGPLEILVSLLREKGVEVVNVQEGEE